MSKKVSFFSPAFARCFKRGINAAVQVIAECVTARWIYTRNYPKSTQPSETHTCKKPLGWKTLGMDAPFPYAVTLNMHIH